MHDITGASHCLISLAAIHECVRIYRGPTCFMAGIPTPPVPRIDYASASKFLGSALQPLSCLLKDWHTAEK